jgi:hypothetical protein
VESNIDTDRFAARTTRHARVTNGGHLRDVAGSARIHLAAAITLNHQLGRREV